MKGVKKDMGRESKILAKISDAAVDGSVSITPLLRQCRILAERLKNDDFKRWVSCELNGYPDVNSIPKYRIIKTESVGNFSGTFGRMANHLPIQVENLPKDVAKMMSRSYLLDGVGVIENLVREDKGDGRLAEIWPTAVISKYAHCFYDNFALVQAYKVISKASVAGVLDVVRNRVLEFVLEIENRIPDFDSCDVLDKDPSIVQNIYSTNILGDGNRVAAGSRNVDQSVFHYEKGNWGYLEGVLKQLKVAQNDINELKNILDNVAKSGMRFW